MVLNSVNKLFCWDMYTYIKALSGYCERGKGGGGMDNFWNHTLLEIKLKRSKGNKL